MLNTIGKVYQRPWGNYKTIALTADYQVKIITVKPQGQLSLQKHQHRTEHWFILAGTPTITLATTTTRYSPNTHLFIPKETVHRLENFTTLPVVVLEVQYGTYLGEDDIIRIADIYGRT